MYKMIVSDLDETLMNDDGSLSAGNQAAIRQAVAHGVYFVFNSGRGYYSFQNDLASVGLAGQAGQYAISYNGGAILENSDNHAIVTNGLDFQVAKAVFAHGAAAADASAVVDVHVYTKDKLYIYSPVKEDVAYLENRGVTWEPMTDSLDFLAEEPIMKVIFAMPTVADRQAMRDQVLAAVTSPLTVTFSSARYVEFNRAGVNKGAATLELANYLKIDPSEIIAAGDNSNDLPMLKVVGMPVSVANGIPAVKAAAKYVTKADNNHDAMKEIIDKFVLAPLAQN